MLPRILEPELMDTAEDAHQYDAMEHAAVNAIFVTDLITALTDWSLQRPVSSKTTLELLDLGAGTAQILIELARRASDLHITAVDAAESMLAVARTNIASAGLVDRIELLHADAKDLRAAVSRDAEARRSGARFDDATYDAVISNSIVHHISEPQSVIAETIRVTAAGGLLFHRDLARPHDETQLEKLVATYAAGATPYQRKLFADSLHAALALEEVRDLVADFGFARETVQMTSDRHWTWSTCKV